MTTKQLLVMVAVTASLALVIAWLIERTQVRAFMAEFDQWWEEKYAGQSKPKPPDGPTPE